MPFRLLGLVRDPNRAGGLCGRSFAHYAAAGVEVTLAAALQVSTEQARCAAEAVGVRNLVLLGFATAELRAADLQPLLIDLIAALRPHVVVAEGDDAGLAEAAAGAFTAARGRTPGSGALPAKLYFRGGAATGTHAITSAIRAPELNTPELFARVYPAPWVTGVLERDLFAGISPEPTTIEERLAS